MKLRIKESVLREMKQIVKPYEENLNKLNKWYNEFFTKTSLFEDRRRIHHGIPDYLTV